jgi:O-antigen/teichoic acid export membrane protein
MRLTGPRLGRVAASAGRVAAVPLASALVSLLVVTSAGAAVWGEYVAVLIIVGLGAQVADFGSRDALLRDLASSPTTAFRRAWRVAFASRLPLLVLLPPIFVRIANDPVVAGWLTLWAVALFVVRLHEAPVVVAGRFGAALGLELAAAVALGLVAVLRGPRLAASDLVVASALLTLARGLALSRLLGTVTLGGWASSVHITELRRSWPFFALGVTGALQPRVDLLIVAATLPAQALGEYQVLANIVLLAYGLAGSLVAPIVPGLYRAPRATVIRAAARSLRLGVAVALLAAGAAWLATSRLYGFSLPPAALVASAIAMAPAFGYSVLVTLAFREGQERLVLAGSVAGILAAAVAGLALIPSTGIGGAMVAAACSQMTVLGVHVARTARWGPVLVGPEPGRVGLPEGGPGPV